MTTLNNTAITGTVSINLPSGQITNADISSSADIETTKLAQRVLAEYPVPWSSFRVWNNVCSLPVNTPAVDDLALLPSSGTGVSATDALTLSTGDQKGNSETGAFKIFFESPVPPEYDDGETIQIRVRCVIDDRVADTAATLDLEAFAPAGDGTSSADLYTGSAANVNSATIANYDFALTAASIDPGDRLQCVLSLVVNDAATAAGTVTGVITNVSLLCDTRG